MFVSMQFVPFIFMNGLLTFFLCVFVCQSSRVFSDEKSAFRGALANTNSVLTNYRSVPFACDFVVVDT
jgi:hypothetical protein